VRKKVGMKIEVNVDECRGYAVCIGVAPEYFDLDEGGIVAVLKGEVDPGDEETVREAALVCPTQAIRVLE
jgi:ferredoxin